MKAELLKNRLDNIEDLKPERNARYYDGPADDPLLRPEWFAALAGSFGHKIDLVTVRRECRTRPSASRPCSVGKALRNVLQRPSTVNKSHWSAEEREHAAFYIFKPSTVGKSLWFWKFVLAFRIWRLNALSPGNLVPRKLQEIK